MKDITFEGDLGDYTLIETEDGHRTLKSHFFEENCHSTSGAWEETLHNYFKGAQVREKYQNNNPLVIFEVGFALGIGPHVCFKELLKETIKNKVIFISSEIDEKFITWTLNHSEFAFFLKENKASITDYEKYVEVTFQNFHLYILKGDLRKSIKHVQEITHLPFDCVFHDPFSPMKNPTLWTKEWFETIKVYMKKDSLLTTYSSAVRFRKALLEAGFQIEKAKGFGMKRTMTRASLNENFGDEKLMSELERSKALAFSEKESD